jgi:hypothetical protein
LLENWDGLSPQFAGSFHETETNNQGSMNYTPDSGVF